MTNYNRMFKEEKQRDNKNVKRGSDADKVVGDLNMDGAHSIVIGDSAVISFTDNNPDQGGSGIEQEEIKDTVITVDDVLTVDPPKEPKTARVISSGKLNLRKGPDKDKQVLCLLNPGSKLLVEDVDDGWAHVYTESGIEGYVMSEFITEV